MPTFEIIATATRILKKKETYSDEEINNLKEMLEGLFIESSAEFSQIYELKVEKIDLVKPTKPLSNIKISIPDLRQHLVELMAQRIDVMELPDMLQLLRTVYKEMAQEEENVTTRD